MHDTATLQALAEAVTDGSNPDWDAAESRASDGRDQALIRHLRAATQIGRVRATLMTLQSTAALGEVALDLKPGDAWGSLRVLERVGRGRFGEVYRAWDPTLDREVALKILRRLEASDPDATLVVDEGRLMARVRHPNVVAIYGAQRIEGRTGLWMEFIHGQTLEAELAQRGPLDAEALTRIGTELCAALEAVHAAGLVHRDVKAQNVMRERSGRVVLGDFGTGRELNEEPRGRPELAGTPTYLAPEIFDRQPATPRSDIYSLGVLLFHLATREYPVTGRTVAAIRGAHKARRLTSLRMARPDLPATLAAAIDRALDPDPQRRFARVDELTRGLGAWREHRARRSKLRIAGVGAGVAALVLVALSGVISRGGAATAAGHIAARDWVLVTAAINRTGDQVLDGTIEYALARELSQSPYINVAPPARVADVLQLMQKPPDTRLDPATSREVALRDGEIRALVTGRVERIGGAYGVSVDVIHPSDGVLLASLSEPAVPQSDLLKAIGRAAIGVRRRLGEGLRSTNASQLELAKVTTPSLKALQLYSQVTATLDGQGGFLRRLSSSEQLLRAAIVEDPDFAAAHLLLSEVIRPQSAKRIDEVLDHIKQALALSGRVTAIERLAIEGALAVQGQVTTVPPAERQRWLEHGIAKNEAILQLQPDNYSALVVLTNLYPQVGRPNASLARRLSDLRPHSFEWAARAASAAMWDGDLETARRYVRRGLAVPIAVYPMAEDGRGVVWMHLFDAFETWLRNDALSTAAVASRVASELDRLPPDARPAFSFQLSYLYLMLGQFAPADAFASQIGTVPQRKMARLHIAIASGDAERISRVLRRDFPTIEEAAGVGSALIMTGQVEEARRALAILQKRPNSGGTFASTFASFIEGQLALADGRLDDAVAGIQAHLQSFRPGQGHYVAETLARALAARGDLAQAIALLESYSGPRFQLVAQPGTLAREWLPLRDRLAVLYRQVGRHKEADAVESELRALLAVADDDHPIKRRLESRAERP